MSAGLWAIVYCSAAFTGQHLVTDRLATDWQMLPLEALRAHPFRSVWYMHTQPPLWNLTVGSFARWSPLPLGFSLQLLMLASGMTLAWSVASILTALGVGRRTTIALTLVATANSVILMFGFLPVYELPAMAFLALTIRAVCVTTTRLTAVVTVSIFGTALVMTRSAYHPVWLVGVLALVFWTQRHQLRRRWVAIAIIVPLVVSGGWSIKNQALFGTTSLSSWTGMNLLRSVEPALDQSDLISLRANGTISAVGLVGHFASYESYKPVVPACTPRHTDAVLDQPLRAITPTSTDPNPTAIPNFNYECFLPIYQQATSDALAIVRARPGAWLQGRGWAINNWFGVKSPREPEHSPVVGALNTVTNVVLVAVAHPPVPKSWEVGAAPLWRHKSPLSLLLILSTIVVLITGTRHTWRLIRSRTDDISRSLILAIAGWTTAWTLFVGCLGELGEQERFRNMVDPIVIAVGGAIIVQWWMKRTPRRLKPQLDRAMTIPIAAVVVLFGVAVVLIGQGPERRTVLAKPPPGLAPLETSSTVTSSTVTSATDPPAAVGSTVAVAPATSPVFAQPVCHRIIHLGDSNLGMTVPLFQFAYQQANIEAVIDSANGRGATVARDGGLSAVDAIAKFKESQPADGRCWIIALSIVDAADSAQSGTDPSINIRKIADAVGNEPTLWITPVSASTSNQFTLQASTAYNVALLGVLANRPNISLLDWQDIALQHLDQFQADGVHYQRPLYDLLVQVVMTRVAKVWQLTQ